MVTPVPFADAPSEFTKSNIWITIDGEDKSGKTHLALTIADAGPTGVIDINESLDGVVQKRIKALSENGLSLTEAKRRVQIAPHPMPFGRTKAELKEKAVERWAAVSKDFQDGLRTKRAVILDSGTDLYRLARYSEFGDVKSTSTKGALDYEAVNSKMRGLTRLFHAHKAHFIVTHQLGDEWKAYRDPETNKMKNVRSGRRVRDGWDNVSFDVEIGIRTDKRIDNEHGLTFFATVEICRFNPHIEGAEFTEIDGNFNLPFIISMATGTEESQWRY